MAARYGAKVTQETWPENTFTPADIGRTIGYSLCKKYVSAGLLRRMRGDVFQPEERELFIEWVVQIGMRPKSTETCVFKLLAPMAFSNEPLGPKLP